MKVTLIQPAIGRVGDKIVKRKRVIESLAIATLAGLTPKDVELQFFDERLEDIDYDTETDLAGISTETLTAKRAYEIAGEYRKRGVPVVLGGFHPSLLPEEAGQHADAVVIGQAENLWPRVIEDARNRRLQKVYIGEKLPAFGETFADRSIYRGKRYVSVRLIEFGRGCHYQCDFCTVHNFYGRQYATRSIANLIAEIEQSQQKNFLFVDDNLFSDRSTIDALCKALTPLKINWLGQASISITNDERFLDRIVESGCKGLLIGFESIHPENLRQMNKRFNLGVEHYEEAIRKLKARSIRLYGSFVFGYDHETRQSIQETVDFAINQKLTVVTFYPLTPFPGTRLYERLKNENRLIKERWWLDPNFKCYDISFIPKNMSAEELSELCIQARKKFYSLRSTLFRALDFKTHAHNLESMYLYFAINVTVNMDIDLKTRTSLGFEGG